MITPEQIKNDIELIFFVEDIATKYRGTNECLARYVFYTLCRKFTNASFPKIGQHVNRTHATVIVGINKLEEIKHYYKNHTNAYDFLEKKYLKEIEDEKLCGHPFDRMIHIKDDKWMCDKCSKLIIKI